MGDKNKADDRALAAEERRKKEAAAQQAEQQKNAATPSFRSGKQHSLDQQLIQDTQEATAFNKKAAKTPEKSVQKKDTEADATQKNREEIRKRFGAPGSLSHVPSQYQAGEMRLFFQGVSRLFTLLDIPVFFIVNYASKAAICCLGHGAGCLAILFKACSLFLSGDTQAKEGPLAALSAAVEWYKETDYAKRVPEVAEFVSYRLGLTACICMGLGIMGDLHLIASERSRDPSFEKLSYDERVMDVLKQTLEVVSGPQLADEQNAQVTENERNANAAAQQPAPSQAQQNPPPPKR